MLTKCCLGTRLVHTLSREYLPPCPSHSQTTYSHPSLLTHTHTHTGDFYVTRHSNLSQVHVVLHLVTDETAVQSSNLRSRNPVLMGLKNCLRMAARYDIHNITVPLLLVHTMQPVSCVCVCVCVCACGSLHKFVTFSKNHLTTTY